MDSNEQLVEQIVKFRGSSEITCPHIAGVLLRQDCSRCWAEFIRSYTDALIAAAVEECASKIENFKFLCERNEEAYKYAKRLFSQAIRDLTPDHVHRALELREVEERIDEWRDAVVYFLSADLHGNDIEKIKKYVKSHSADLERRREELEEEKHV